MATSLNSKLTVESTEGISEMWFREPFRRWGVLRFRIGVRVKSSPRVNPKPLFGPILDSTATRHAHPIHNPNLPPATVGALCSADGSTHTEINTLYRKVKHRARPNLSSRQRPKRAPIRRRSRRRQRRAEPHTKHGLGVLLAILSPFFSFRSFCRWPRGQPRRSSAPSSST